MFFSMVFRVYSRNGKVSVFVLFYRFFFYFSRQIFLVFVRLEFFCVIVKICQFVYVVVVVFNYCVVFVVVVRVFWRVFCIERGLFSVVYRYTGFFVWFFRLCSRQVEWQLVLFYSQRVVEIIRCLSRVSREIRGFVQFWFLVRVCFSGIFFEFGFCCYLQFGFVLRLCYGYYIVCVCVLSCCWVLQDFRFWVTVQGVWVGRRWFGGVSFYLCRFYSVIFFMVLSFDILCFDLGYLGRGFVFEVGLYRVQELWFEVQLVGRVESVSRNKSCCEYIWLGGCCWQDRGVLFWRGASQDCTGIDEEQRFGFVGR